VNPDEVGIREWERWHNGLKDFSWLAPECGGTDIDRMIERNGRFLFLEGKTWHAGVHVPLGQHIAYMKLAQIAENDVYLVGIVRDDEGKPTGTFHTVRYGPVHPIVERRSMHFPPWVFIERTAEQMSEFVRAWWKAAAGRGRG
jgi:hypothetical protein